MVLALSRQTQCVSANENFNAIYDETICFFYRGIQRCPHFISAKTTFYFVSPFGTHWFIAHSISTHTLPNNENNYPGKKTKMLLFYVNLFNGDSPYTYLFTFSCTIQLEQKLSVQVFLGKMSKNK